MNKYDLKRLIRECINETNDRLYNAFKDSVFSVNVNSEEVKNSINHIGDWIELNNKWKGIDKFLPHKIMHLQKDYKGTICYRVENQLNSFGQVVHIEYIKRYMNENDAEKMWRKNYLTYVSILIKKGIPYDREFISFESKW